MKGIVFTLDALFALIIAVSAISILLYFQFYSQTPYQIRYSEASGIMQTLLSANVSSIAAQDPIAAMIVQQTQAQNASFSGFPDQYNSGYSLYGPSEPGISYIISVNSMNSPTHSVFVCCNKIFFQGSTRIYAYNKTSGTLSWEHEIAPQTVSSMAVYDGVVFYANDISITALNAYNGNLMWTDAQSVFTGQTYLQFGYGHEVVLTDGNANGNNLAAVYANNGTLAWTYNPGLPSPPYTPWAQVADGNIAADYVSPANVFLLGHYGDTGGTLVGANTLWGVGNACTISGLGISVLQGTIACGDGDEAQAMQINGIASFSQAMLNTVEGIANNLNNTFVFLAANELEAVTTSNSVLWSYAVPPEYGEWGHYFGLAIGGNKVYSEWPGNEIVAQGLSNGTAIWTAHLPNGLDRGSGPSLGYGMLYAEFGSNVIAFGSPCPTASAGDSLLYASAEADLNGHGSCAEYLLGKMHPLNNYTLALNNQYLYNADVANFTVNSYVSANVQQINMTAGGFNTVSFWMRAGSPQGGSSVMPFGFNNYDLIENNNGDCFGFNTAQGDAYGFNALPMIVNRWVFVTATFINNAPYTGNNLLYINGVNQTLSTSAAPCDPGTVNVWRTASQNIQISGWPTSSQYMFNGLIADLQIYNTDLNAQQINQLYTGGIDGAPLPNAGNIAWYPLVGDTNDYSGLFNTGFPVNVIYSPASGYAPISLKNAFEVSRSSVPLPLINYTTGLTRIYNVSVVTWR